MNTPILIYKDVFNFLNLFDIAVKYNGDEIPIDDGKFLFRRVLRVFFGVYRYVHVH